MLNFAHESGIILILLQMEVIFMNKTKKLVTSALLAAFACIATLISVGPLPPTNGYIHLGDALVIMCGFILGPIYGGIAAAIGSAAADCILGYVVYAPATFVIKFLVALTAGLLYRAKPCKTPGIIWISVLAELVMIVGYYIFEAFILTGGIGAVAALYAIPANAIQALSGVIIATIITKIFKSNAHIRKLL